MRTKNCLSWFRDALTFSALLLGLPAVCPVQDADRSQLFPSALQEAQLGPQPPCRKEPIPPYPGLDDSPVVHNLIYFDSNRVDDVILVNERVRSNRFERGGENVDVEFSATITPEPGSGTLLLLGLAGLGMILYWCDALKNAI
jgi:hypothetical protein